MLVNLNKILPKARKQRYAVGAFNTSNLEITQAIIRAAEKKHSPVIIATSEKAIAYAGIEHISQIVTTMAARTEIPVVLHLDHGRSLEIVKYCIQNNYSSVMIDASHLSFKDNVNLTKKIVRYAHKHNISVEAEIGRLAGIEDTISVAQKEAIYTDPKEAERFARETACDALAIAIGTSHGAYKFKSKPQLRIDILKSIADRIKIPLVLHGASSVKIRWINRLNRYGGEINKARGVPDRLIQQAVRSGIAKINTDTDLRMAFTAGLREHLSTHPDDFDPRASIGHARDMIEQVVKDRISIFGSQNQA